MDLEPTDVQLALQGELRRFLDGRVTPEHRRAIAAMPGAVDRDLWRGLGGMGTFALTVPEAAGGVGLGLADATLVFEELGRALVPGPLIGTFLAAGLAAEGVVDAGAAALLDGAATGEAVVGLTPAAAPAFVEHLAALDALLVVDGGGVALTGPPRGGRPVARPLDPLTPVDVVDELPAGPLLPGGAARAGQLRTAAALLAAALQVGVAGAAVALATAYAGQRTQFGRVIGSFQALKHLLADAQVGIEVARAAVGAAGVEIDDAVAGEGDPARAHRAVDGARIVASRAAGAATRTCVQVHGGMGYTWDLDAHLLVKRALVLDVTPGTPEEAAASLAAAL
ncbi:MAG TPA: acyl-CoA dehydrogenase family protein [Acidimicrobiales bacterium]|nr:acyl-CoA dehydrogenase family protein [Acidimicrobiales bacterium]